MHPATNTAVQSVNHMPGPDIMDWLSHSNHKENKDQEIGGMRVNANAITTFLHFTFTFTLV